MRRPALALAFAALVLAACELPVQIHPPSEPLADTAWELTAYRIADGPLLTVEPDSADLDGPYVVRFHAEGAFSDDQEQGLSGSTGCNVFNAGYRTDGRTLVVSDLAITIQGCGHATEGVFAYGLRAADTWSIDADTLHIVYEDGLNELFLTRD